MNTMNENNDGPQPWIDPALEARIVAGVLGETSAFEAAELERVLAGNPELAIFKRRIEAVHALVGVAFLPKQPKIQLSPERRRKLLETIGVRPEAPRKKVKAIPFPFAAWLSPHILSRIAACLIIGGIIALLSTLGMPAVSGSLRKASVRSFSSPSSGDRGSFVTTEGLASSLTDEASVAAKPMDFAMNVPPPMASAAPISMPTAGLTAGDSFGIERRAGDSTVPMVATASSAPMPSTVQQSQFASQGQPQERETSDRMASFEAPRAGGTTAVSSVNEDGPDSAGPSSRREALGEFPAMQNGKNLSDAQAGAIRAFTGGWGKGSGSGGGAGDADSRLAKRVVSDLNVPGSATAQLEIAKAEKAELSDRSDKSSEHKLAGADTYSRGTMKFGDASMFRGAQVVGDTKESGEKSAATPVPGDVPISGKSLSSKDKKDRAPAFQDEIKTAKQPFSTFSLHVSDVSFQLAKDALAKGAMPDPERIRAEEFYNAFDYNDPAPADGEEVACRIEQCAHPFAQQRNLVRIALKVAATGRAGGQPLRLTILLDTSGSMEREDRAASVRRALKALASLLGPNDRVTLIGFARTPRLLAGQVPGDQAEKLVGIAARTPSEGGTNLEQALVLASELAHKQYLPAAQNRIVLLTDGAANLGDANPARLARQIEKTRQQGVSFDACGVGANGLNDEMLEALTRKGDGRYYFLNRPEDADAGFARQLAGALRPAAENVKVQVVFNPARVGRYRLIGFEKHLLKKEDFRDDKVQAAELSAEEAGVALYQVETLPGGDGELGEVFVRFRDPANGMMVERSWTMPYDAKAPAFENATPSMQLAATSALLAERLRGDSRVDLNALAPVVTNLRGRYSHQAKVGELIRMFERMRR